jgi:hypothetical protein
MGWSIGEWQALENGRCWRMADAGEGKGLENFVLQPPSPFSARRDRKRLLSLFESFRDLPLQTLHVMIRIQTVPRETKSNRDSSQFS